MVQALKKGATPTKQQQDWSVESWRNFPIQQQPEYPDAAALKSVEERLKVLPPLTTPNEARDLKAQLAKAAKGEAFLLQGGDCAESFAEFNQVNLTSYFRVILQMTVALMYGAGVPVVKVGRIAGQFAKPRSTGTETVGGVELPSYRGDMVNGIDFTAEARVPDPERWMSVYYQSAATLNYLRSLAVGGYAGLRQINHWNTSFIANSPQGKRFQTMVDRINENYDFMSACGLKPDTMRELSEA
ncbi:MAG: 3-deoxy-7-phosphoheptulonate synthase, partial [Alphaproteobacteria bacterium]|nr:3-deoxy-7-phosphoheptulonate synthase [Alphaproteobacteria bacterium]